MGDQIQFIVKELNKSPFNKDFNLISFDSLSGTQLLQVLGDVFSELDPNHKINPPNRDPDEKTAKVLQMLRILNYKPPNNDMDRFVKGLVQGESRVVHPILEWILQRLPELKKRCYLANFLVKVDVPQEFLGDNDVAEIYAQYVNAMEEFKVAHKQHERMQGATTSTSEIRKDISNMAAEKEQLSKRIERLKKKVESYADNAPMLAAVKQLQAAQEREAALVNQKKEQRVAVNNAELRVHRLKQQLQDLKRMQTGTTPEGLVKRLEEEAKINAYIAKEKLPTELGLQKRYVADMEKVATNPVSSRPEVDALYVQLKNLSTEINSLVEKKAIGSEPTDDKLSLFRQQAAIVARKKISAAEVLKEVQGELTRLEAELAQKYNGTQPSAKIEILKGEEFKEYVAKLRSTSVVYKKKRQELSDMKAEIGVLKRTEEVVNTKHDAVRAYVATLEEEKGVMGYREAQDELEKVSAKKSEYDKDKVDTLTDMSSIVNSLHAKISAKKAALAPIIKELRPLRNHYQDLGVIFEEKKTAHASCAAGLEANLSKLEQQVKKLEDEVLAQESRYHLLNCQNQISQMYVDRMTAEIKFYVTADAAEKKKSYREQYTQQIHEQEKLGKSLREEHKMVRDNQAANESQMKMWKDLNRFLECKRRTMSYER